MYILNSYTIINILYITYIMYIKKKLYNLGRLNAFSCTVYGDMFLCVKAMCT